jgi:hypothetical protein
LSVSCDTRLRIYRTGCGANPSPGPILGPLDDSGLDGVLEDVFQGRLELLVAFDRLRIEALAEDVVAAVVDGVEGARVVAVEIAHPLGEVLLRRLDDEVVVRAEQAPRVEPPAVAADDPPQLVEEAPAIVV